MGKSTISMVIFNSYVKLPEGTCWSISGWNEHHKCRNCWLCRDGETNHWVWMGTQMGTLPHHGHLFGDGLAMVCTIHLGIYGLIGDGLSLISLVWPSSRARFWLRWKWRRRWSISNCFMRPRIKRPGHTRSRENPEWRPWPWRTPPVGRLLKWMLRVETEKYHELNFDRAKKCEQKRNHGHKQSMEMFQVVVRNSCECHAESEEAARPMLQEGQPSYLMWGQGGGRGSDPCNKTWATDASISDVKLCDCDLVLGFCFWRIYIIGGRIWRK